MKRKISRGRNLMAFACLLSISFMTPTHLCAQTFSVPQKTAPLRVIIESVNEQTDYYLSCYLADSILNRPWPAGFHNLGLHDFLTNYLPRYGLTYSKDTNNPYRINISRALSTMGLTPAAQDTLLRVKGIVFRRDGIHREMLMGITAELISTGQKKCSDSLGVFVFEKVPANAVIRLTGINVLPMEVKATSAWMSIQMRDKIDSLQETSVVSNGYEEKIKDSSTWVVKVIPRARLDQRTSPNPLQRIDGHAAGVLFQRLPQNPDGSNPADNIKIGGLSTINSGTQPLIVVDDFPFNGDINSINPEDIESIDILKDASALSLWGVKAGNAVIVIVTKKAKTKKPLITFTTSMSVQRKPDVFNFKPIPPADLIAFEKDAYHAGYYAPNFANSLDFEPIPPVVSILYDDSLGRISHEEAVSRIATMQKNNIQNDISRYLYQMGSEQQYTLQISRSTSRLNYFLSGGVYQSIGTMTGVSQQRSILRAQLEYIFSPSWRISGYINNAGITRSNGNNPGFDPISMIGGKRIPSFLQLADSHGNPLAFNGDYRPDFVQQRVASGYLDPTWYPLKDIRLEQNKWNTHNVLAGLDLTHRFGDRWRLSLKYQHERQQTKGYDLHETGSYFVNYLRNSLTSQDSSTGKLTCPVPEGGIADTRLQLLTGNQVRLQGEYQHKHEYAHNLSVIGGFEYRDVKATGDSTRQYAVGNTSAPSVSENNIYYPSGITGIVDAQTIPVNLGQRTTIDRYFSSFLSATYTYRGRYTFSGTFREDVANLFGASMNNKWQPLWSLGAAWHLEKEEFFKPGILSKLAIQTSVGVLGNISRLSSAYTTIATDAGDLTGTSYATARLLSLSNPDLRWEKVRIYSLGLTFATWNDRIHATIEGYTKGSTDLMASALIDPTKGGIQSPLVPPSYFLNIASMHTGGLDLDMTSHNLRGDVDWTSNLLFSIVSSRITSYPGPAGKGSQYLDINQPNPVYGRSPFGVYAYKWRYLDGSNGAPVGSFNGQPSTDWDAICNNTSLESMVYKGPAQPPVFGSLRNTVSKGRFSFFFNISFKFGYYTRKPAVSYTDALQTWNSHASYTLRWQQPGDERHTNVPATDFTGNSARDFFYANSEVNVVRADNIRLEEIGLIYEVKGFSWRAIPFQRLRLILNVSNLGPLYLGNKEHIDVDYNNIPRGRMRLSFGASLSF